ncbi:MAG: hypothetical protein EXR53_04015 [Dehalococcoidia bacterium]|nr:hypothetical protein [Dehalococcoidia bacterium]
MRFTALTLGILLSLLMFGTALADSSGVLAAPSAVPVGPGFDLFETAPAATEFDFSGLPIP